MTSDPTIMFSPVNKVVIDDDNITAVTSNALSRSTSSFSTAFSLVAQALPTRYNNKNGNAFPFPLLILTAAPAQQSKWAYAALTIASNKVIADSGATQIFIMDGTLVHNKQKTMCPLKVVLADGHRVMYTHVQHYSPRPPSNSHWTHHPQVVHCLPFWDPCTHKSRMYHAI